MEHLGIIERQRCRNVNGRILNKIAKNIEGKVLGNVPRVEEADAAGATPPVVMLVENAAYYTLPMNRS